MEISSLQRWTLLFSVKSSRDFWTKNMAVICWTVKCFAMFLSLFKWCFESVQMVLSTLRQGSVWWSIKIQPDAVHDCDAPPPNNTCHQEVFFYWGNPSLSLTCKWYWEGEHRKVSSTEFFGFRPRFILFFWVYIQYTVPQMPLTPRWPRASSPFKKWRWTNWVSMICVKKVWQNWADWTSGRCRHFGMLKKIHRWSTNHLT